MLTSARMRTINRAPSESEECLASGGEMELCGGGRECAIWGELELWGGDWGRELDRVGPPASSAHGLERSRGGAWTRVPRRGFREGLGKAAEDARVES